MNFIINYLVYFSFLIIFFAIIYNLLFEIVSGCLFCDKKFFEKKEKAYVGQKESLQNVDFNNEHRRAVTLKASKMSRKLSFPSVAKSLFPVNVEMELFELNAERHC